MRYGKIFPISPAFTSVYPHIFVSVPATFLTYLFYILATLHLFIVIRQSLIILFHKKAPKSNERKSFSIIVAAHNEARNLRELIPLLLNQNYPNFEVIIALDRCTDGSLQLEGTFSDNRLKFLDLKDVPAHFHGKKYALTQAMHAAKNEWMLLTDADCRPASDQWISAFNEGIDPEKKLILGVSPYTRSPGLLNELILYETLQTAISYISEALKGTPYMGVGRNLAYRKALFVQRGGFAGHAHLTGGDDDLFVQANATKHNTAIMIDPKSLTYSAPKRTWKEYLMQKVRHLSVGKHYKTAVSSALTLNLIIHTMLWLSFLSLILIYPDRWRIIIAFVMLLMVKGLFFKKVANKTGLTYSILRYPVVDFLFAVFLPLLGIRAFFVKNIKWS